jgi:hypothetical protein
VYRAALQRETHRLIVRLPAAPLVSGPVRRGADRKHIDNVRVACVSLRVRNVGFATSPAQSTLMLLAKKAELERIPW